MLQTLCHGETPVVQSPAKVSLTRHTPRHCRHVTHSSCPPPHPPSLSSCHSLFMPFVTVVQSLTLHRPPPPPPRHCRPVTHSSCPPVTVVLSLTRHAPRHCRPVTHSSCPPSLSSCHSLVMPFVAVVLSLTLHAPPPPPPPPSLSSCHSL